MSGEHNQILFQNQNLYEDNFIQIKAPVRLLFSSCECVGAFTKLFKCCNFVFHIWEYNNSRDQVVSAFYTGIIKHVTKLLQELGWESLQTRRKYKRITTLYKMEHNIIDIPLDQYIMHNTRCSRKHNSQCLQIRHSSNTFGNSFFPTTAKEWNALPSNIISSSSIESFQKNLTKYLIDH